MIKNGDTVIVINDDLTISECTVIYSLLSGEDPNNPTSIRVNEKLYQKGMDYTSRSFTTKRFFLPEDKEGIRKSLDELLNTYTKNRNKSVEALNNV